VCDSKMDRDRWTVGQTDNADHYYSWRQHCGGPANNIKYLSKHAMECHMCYNDSNSPTHINNLLTMKHCLVSMSE